MRSGVLFLLACVLGLGVAACGEDTDGPNSAAAQTSPAGDVREPLCDQLWVDGHALPDQYRGCSDADGAWVEAAKTRCDSGQVLVTYDDRFYGAMGAVVNDVGSSLADDRQYRRASRSCG